ncbi:MAG: type II toxin-antitoxin system VapC family toxin [Acidobacteria bacterium]|nr:type II toxin-antitoxin system VapC family toxin [Acidobacteriota bacterium]
MKVITDTHALVWALSSPDKLSRTAKTALSEQDVVASVANLWELLLKSSKSGGLLTEPIPWWDKYVVRAGVPILPIRNSHVMALARLPDHHRDPFDRILVAQAFVEKATLITKDETLRRYSVPVLW